MDNKDNAQEFVRKLGKFDDSDWILGHNMNEANNCRSIHTLELNRIYKYCSRTDNI